MTFSTANCPASVLTALLVAVFLACSTFSIELIPSSATTPLGQSGAVVVLLADGSMPPPPPPPPAKQNQNSASLA
jgi:hypothetical protein